MSEKFSGRPYGRERRLLFYLTFLNCIYLFTYLQGQNHQRVHVQVAWAGLPAVAWRTRDASYRVPITSAVFLLNGDNELGFE